MEVTDKAKKLVNDHADEIVSAGARLYNGVTGKTLDVDKLKLIVLDRKKDVVKKAIEVCARDVWDEEGVGDAKARAGSLIAKLFSGSEAMQDESVQELVTYFHLQDPEELSRFLVELHLAQIDSFNDSIDLLSDLHINDYAAKIKDGESFMKKFYRAETEEEQCKQLESADVSFMKARHCYEGAIKIYINRVQAIVNKPKFFRSLELKNMDKAMKALRGMLEAEREVVRLQYQVAQLKNEATVDAVDEYRDFYADVIEPNITLLQGCSIDADETFWRDVKENGNVIQIME